MLKLKLQYFGYLMQRTNSFLKTLMPGKIEGRRRRSNRGEIVGWHHQVNGLSKLWEMVKAWKPVVMQFMGSERAGYN